MMDEHQFIHAVTAHWDGSNRLHENGDKAHEIYQASFSSALLEGVFDGDMTLTQLVRHGDFGLGTFNGLDGELLLLDGKVYQLRADGKAAVPKKSVKIPFAAVIFFRPELELTIKGSITRKSFEKLLEKLAPSHNLFYAIKVAGFFKRIKVRSVPRQSKPYPPLIEVTRHQPVFEHSGVNGIMAGFRCPDYSHGLNVAGYHFHFIDDDKKIGGHVLDFELNGGILEVDHTSSFHVELPKSKEFTGSHLKGKKPDDMIRSVEK